MNEQQIEHGLREMSTWTGDDTRLWEQALEAERGRMPRPGRTGWVRSPRMAAALLAAAGAGVVLMGVLGDQPERGTPGGAGIVPRELDRAQASHAGRSSDQPPRMRDNLSSYSADSRTQPPLASALVVLADGSEELQQPADARQIAYSASATLRSSDVHHAADTLRTLIRTDQGEYIESAVVRGEGGSATARVVLRVSSERLDEVLAAVRGIGDVVSESVQAEDLTSQLVDVEARLRNERRVEAELLELMEAREELDLEGLVRLRRELGQVRGRIEQMEAQRLAMARRVSLSTVRVDVEGRQSPPRTESGWSRFLRGLGDAWSDGIWTLAGSVQAILAFLVGRVIWWVGGLLILITAWRLWKRQPR
ncbi:MAG: DUF4349 domain-containing protein [Phycisphaerales bacterium]|nr:DUF4349 domain-containing protein [Planctomycetota bacterium]MCH8509675.1 DUF4349 domain-containing protein [Phycisphaerales bacterium]